MNGVVYLQDMKEQTKKPAAKRAKGRPPKSDEKARRELVIATTRKLLRRHPPSALTQVSIAKAARVDAKLLRYYFGTLDNLFNVVLNDMLDELASRMAVATDRPGTARERMRYRIETLTEFYVENPHWWAMLTSRVYEPQTKWAADLRKDFNLKSFARLMSVIDHGRRDGEFRPDFEPRLLYLALVGLSEILMTGAPILAVLMPGASRAEQRARYLEFIVDFVFRGIQSEAEAPSPQ